MKEAEVSVKVGDVSKNSVLISQLSGITVFYSCESSSSNRYRCAKTNEVCARKLTTELTTQSSLRI